MSAMRPIVRSMTGFGSSELDLGELVCRVTVKGVNHRFLDLHVRLPSGCDELEAELRRTVKAAVVRGHVEVMLEMQSAQAGPRVRINEALFRSLAEELRALAEGCGMATEVDAASLLRVPGMLTQHAGPEKLLPAEWQARVAPVLEAAIAQFQKARELEGAELVRQMSASMLRLADMLGGVRGLRAGVRQAQFMRLRERLRELLRDAVVSEERLLTEAALLAEKSDVEEEAVRLQTHIDRFLAILDEGGAVGKRLDFLLQEFNREANTVLSKSGSAAGPESMQLIALGLEMKAEIERVREQVQNLE